LIALRKKQRFSVVDCLANYVKEIFR